MKKILAQFILFTSCLFISQLTMAQFFPIERVFCSLDNPQNMVVDGDYYFHEELTIILGPGQEWNINSITGGNIHVLPLPNPQTTPISIPYTGLSSYTLDMWILSGETAEIQATSSAGSSINTTIGGCTAPSPSATSIPTLSEWGLIILALLLMTFGTLYLVQQPRFEQEGE